MFNERMLNATDAAAAGAWLAKEFRLPKDQEAALVRIMPQLLAAGVLRGTCVVDAKDANGGALQALGMSVFVDRNYTDKYLAAPHPFLFVETLKRVVGGAQSILLGLNEQAAANRGDGLDLVLLYLQRDWDFANPNARRIGELSHRAFIRHHRGNRIERILHEDWQRATDIYVAAGFNRLADFETPGYKADGGAGQAAKRVVYISERSQCLLAAPGTSVSFVHNYVPPICGFTRGQQRALTLAIEGVGDEEIALTLGISPNTLKQVWRSVYDRLGTAFPNLFALDEGPAEQVEGRRGPEKRRRAIAFLKDHLQELRPH